MLHRCTYHDLVAHQYDVRKHDRSKPHEEREGCESNPSQCGISHAPTAHRPPLPNSGKRIQERERNDQQAGHAEDGVEVVVGLIPIGATSDGAVGGVCRVATVIPPREWGARAYDRPVDHLTRLAKCTLVPQTLGALVKRAHVSRGGVALNAGDVTVGHGPVRGDEAL